jgi:hypothetical protein
MAPSRSAIGSIMRALEAEFFLVSWRATPAQTPAAPNFSYEHGRAPDLCAVRPRRRSRWWKTSPAHLINANIRLSFDLGQDLGAKAPDYGTDEPDGVRSMPTDIIVIAMVAAVFGLFAATLYWADLQTRGLTK